MDFSLGNMLVLLPIGNRPTSGKKGILRNYISVKELEHLRQVRCKILYKKPLNSFNLRRLI